MTNSDTPSPQMELILKLLSDYSTRDLSDVGQFLAKDFKYQTFPETVNHPEETKGEHLENWGGILASFAKMEVRIQPGNSHRTHRPIAITSLKSMK